jgi:hypothetical protein
MTNLDQKDEGDTSKASSSESLTSATPGVENKKKKPMTAKELEKHQKYLAKQQKKLQE